MRCFCYEICYDVLRCIVQECDLVTRMNIEEAFGYSFKVKPRKLDCVQTFIKIWNHIDTVKKYHQKYISVNGSDVWGNPWKEHCQYILGRIQRKREGRLEEDYTPPLKFSLEITAVNYFAPL